MRAEKILILMLYLSLACQGVLAFGVGPARATFDYAPDTTLEGQFRIVAQDLPLRVQLTPEGEFASDIVLEQTTITLDKPETIIQYMIKPDPALKPGSRQAGITISEQIDEDNTNNVVVARTAAVHQIILNVPYPGKYLEGKLYVTNTNVNESIIFTVSVFNFGKQALDSVKATVYIKGPTNEELAVKDTETISLSPQQESKLVATWQTPNPGLYLAEVVLIYDGTPIMLRQNFEVGSMGVRIEDLTIPNFRLGQIAKIDITLRNDWNEPLTVNGKIDVLKQNAPINTIQALPTNVPARGTATMSGYWNTEGLAIGDYDLAVKADYNGKSTERLFSAIVSIDAVKFKESATAMVSGQSGSGSVPIFAVLVVILIIVNVILITFILKRFRKIPK